MTERENLPTVIATQAMTVQTEQRGSLAGRGLAALQKSKKREIIHNNSQDERYRQARAVYDRRDNAIIRWNEKDNPDIFSAFKIFQQLSDENYGKAYYPRYLLYQTRLVIEEGHKNAIHFIRLAFDWCFANQTNQDAELWCDLGCLYYSGILHDEKNDELSVYWLRKAAEQNNAEAQWRLACKYETGKGVKQNKEQAVHWWIKAAEQGNPIAQGALGRYLFRLGDKQSDTQAMYWLGKAANQGNTIAQNTLRDLDIDWNK